MPGGDGGAAYRRESVKRIRELWLPPCGSCVNFSGLFDDGGDPRDSIDVASFAHLAARSWETIF